MAKLNALIGTLFLLLGAICGVFAHQTHRMNFQWGIAWAFVASGLALVVCAAFFPDADHD